MTLAVPCLSCSMHAEALGLRAGLALVLLVLGKTSGLRVVPGDNLPVMRLAAANGRMKTPDIWEILEAPLMFSSLQDWDCRWTAAFHTAVDFLHRCSPQSEARPFTMA